MNYELLVKLTEKELSYPYPRIEEKFKTKDILDYFNTKKYNQNLNKNEIISFVQKIMTIGIEEKDKFDFEFYRNILILSIKIFIHRNIFKFKSEIENLFLNNNLLEKKSRFSIDLDEQSLLASHYLNSKISVEKILKLIQLNKNEKIYFLGIGRGSIPASIDIVNYLNLNYNLNLDLDIIPLSLRKKKHQELKLEIELFEKIRKMKKMGFQIILFHEDISYGDTAKITYNAVVKLLHDTTGIFTLANSTSNYFSNEIKKSNINLNLL